MTATKTVETSKPPLPKPKHTGGPGAGVVRIAVDSEKDAAALAEIRTRTTANLAVDLQENFRLAKWSLRMSTKFATTLGIFTTTIATRPGKTRSVHRRAGRTERLCDSDRCELRQRRSRERRNTMPMIRSRPCSNPPWSIVSCSIRLVSLAMSCRSKTAIRRRWSKSTSGLPTERPDVPLHLGVTEAGMPPDGIIKTRVAFEQLIGKGIGDTVRVSLTLPNAANPKKSRRDGRSSTISMRAESAAW